MVKDMKAALVQEYSKLVGVLKVGQINKKE
jgi:hypothetical protein